MKKNDYEWLVNGFILLLLIVGLIFGWIYREDINAKVLNFDNRYVTKEELELFRKDIISKIPSITFIPYVTNQIESTPTPIETEEIPVIYDTFEIRNVFSFGAISNDEVDDTQSIFSAISDLPETGGIIYFPPGRYIVTETIVLENDGITLEGAGLGRLGYMWGTPEYMAGATVIQWNGNTDGVLLKVGNGVIPNAGCTIKNIVLDGNSKANSLIIADATYYFSIENLAGYDWQNGYAIIIRHTKGVVGAGEKYYTWSNITLLNPFENGGGLDIAPEGSLNINQINISGCNIARSNVDNYNYSSLRLGYVDHISFYRCVFMTDISAHDWSEAGGQYNRENPYAITVDPTSEHRSFPMNISFYGTSIYGGINYINEHSWKDNNFHALLFYPYYSADWQIIPPHGYINGEEGLLPTNLVGGFTDRGLNLVP